MVTDRPGRTVVVVVALLGTSTIGSNKRQPSPPPPSIPKVDKRLMQYFTVSTFELYPSHYSRRSTATTLESRALLLHRAQRRARQPFSQAPGVAVRPRSTPWPPRVVTLEGAYLDLGRASDRTGITARWGVRWGRASVARASRAALLCARLAANPKTAAAAAAATTLQR